VNFLVNCGYRDIYVLLQNDRDDPVYLNIHSEMASFSRSSLISHRDKIGDCVNLQMFFYIYNEDFRFAVFV